MNWTTLSRAGFALALAVVLCLSHQARATTLTFAQNTEGGVPGDNDDLNATTDNYGSNIAVETPSFITSDGTGATPDIGLTWKPLAADRPNVFEFHSAGSWSQLNGASHPNAGAPYLQLDVDSTPSGAGLPDDPTIEFTAPAGVQVQFYGLDFGIGSGYTGPDYGWTVNVVRLSDSMVVDTQSTGPLNASDSTYLDIDFIGDAGVSYALHFDDGGANQFSTAIDNLGFSQIGSAIPEPATLGLLALGLALGTLRRQQ